MAYAETQAWVGAGLNLERGDGASPEVFTHITEIKKLDRSGMKMDFDDATNFDSLGAYKEPVATLLDPGGFTFEGNYIPNDATQKSLQDDFDNRRLGNWKIILPPGPGFATSEGEWHIKAYIESMDFSAAHDKLGVLKGALKAQGKPTFVAGS